MRDEGRTRVVVPARYADAGLVRVLISLAAQQRCSAFETVVVFDGVDHAEVETFGAEWPWVRCLSQPQAGSAAALNRGAEDLDDGLLIFVDADMTCEAQFVAMHQEAHQGRTGAVVIGLFPTEPVEPSFFAHVLDEWTAGWMHAITGPARFDTVCSGNMSIRAATFRAVGGFDPTFAGWGRADSELGVRLIASGYDVVVEPKAIAHQRYRKSPGDFCADFRSLGAADVALAKRHPLVLPDLLVSRLHRAPWPLVALRELALAGTIDDYLAMTLATLDQAELDRRTDEDLVQMLWIAADLSYWRGVRDADAVATRLALESASILVFHNLASTGITIETVIELTRGMRGQGRTFLDVGALCGMTSDERSWPAAGVCITFDDGLAAHLAVGRHLAAADIPATFFIPTALLDEPGHLSRADVRELVTLGLDVQMHGHRHVAFTSLPNVEVAEEVKRSREILSELGAEPCAIALPFGATDRSVRESLHSIGVKHAFSTVSARADRLGDPLDVSRITVPDGSTAGDLRWLVEQGTSPRHALVDAPAALRRSRPAAYWEQAGPRDPTRIFQFLSARTG